MLTYTSWVNEKIKIAQAIDSGCCGGSYDEGALIACASISAMAALAWPGDRIDKKRFVEILAQVADGNTNPNPLKISIPLLCQEDQFFKSILLPSNKSFYKTEENDKDYSELIDCLRQKGIAIDTTQQQTIKKNSYGFLLYNQVRCGFVHEYKTLSQNELVFIMERQLKKVGFEHNPDSFIDQEALSAVAQLSRGNFRLLDRLLQQILRIMQINQTKVITKEIVLGARECLVIGNQ